MSDAHSPERTTSDHPAATAAVRQAEEPARTPQQDDANRDAAPGPASTPKSSRDARIAQLQEQYLDGTYEIDAAKVSAKIVDGHLTKS